MLEMRVCSERTGTCGIPFPTYTSTSYRLFRLNRATCFSRLRPAGIGGYTTPYPSSLVDWVAEPKGVAALVFCQTVIALRPGVRIPSQEARLDRWPPRLDGGGQAVRLGCVSGGGLLVEAVQAGPDDVAFGVRAGQRKDAAKLLLDHVGLKDLHPGVAGVDQRVPHPGKGFGA